MDAEKKCLTPSNCAQQYGWFRAFCEKCQADKAKQSK